MAGPLIKIITSADPKVRDQSLDAVCARATAASAAMTTKAAAGTAIARFMISPGINFA